MDAIQKIVALARDPNVAVDTTTSVLALIISLIVAFFISVLYRVFYENRATGSQIHRSFILLGPAVTALFLAIQYSLPLSLGLLGALSIIRFRTPIKEPEEVGFIMLLTACSVVIATFKLILLAALLLIVTLGLTIKRFLPSATSSARKDGIVLVSVKYSDTNTDQYKSVRDVLANYLPRAKLESITQAEELVSLQFSFCDLSSDQLDSVQQKLAELGDVQSFNVYFNKTSSLM